MKVKNITYPSNSPFWNILLSPIINFFLSIVSLAFIPIILIVLLYQFIKTKIFGIKEIEVERISVESVLFENEQFKIIEDDVTMEEEAKDYRNDDEDLYIYKLIDKKQPSSLGTILITNFHILLDKKLGLQKMGKENGKIKSYLISFDLETAEMETIAEIGDYVLRDYHQETKTIYGIGDKNGIKIELE